jgi:hypothetical protein
LLSPVAFFVTALTADPYVYYDSTPDSGYSVDNLAPDPPALFRAAYVWASGGTALHWICSKEADLFGHRLYRGLSADFVPGPGNLVVAKRDTGYLDVGPVGRYYKLSAVDVHGNESKFVLIRPEDTLGVPAGEALSFALGPVSPNPVRGDRLKVAFVLARPGATRLELLDVAGRRVAEREVGSLGVGRHEVDLARGTRLLPGLHLLRLTQGTDACVRRAVVVN